MLSLKFTLLKDGRDQPAQDRVKSNKSKVTFIPTYSILPLKESISTILIPVKLVTLLHDIYL